MNRIASAASRDAANPKVTSVAWATADPLGISDAEGGDALVRSSPGPNVRSYWQCTAPDSFVVVRERRDGERWSEGRRVDYRQPGPAQAR